MKTLKEIWCQIFHVHSHRYHSTNLRHGCHGSRVANIKMYCCKCGIIWEVFNDRQD